MEIADTVCALIMKSRVGCFFDADDKAVSDQFLIELRRQLFGWIESIEQELYLRSMRDAEVLS